MCSRGREDEWQGGVWRTRWVRGWLVGHGGDLTFHADKQEEHGGTKSDHEMQAFSAGN